MKFDIDLELSNLLIKHHVFRWDKNDILGFGDIRCEYCEKSKKDSCISETKIKHLLNKMFDDFASDASVAIRGAGENTNEIIKLLSDENKSKIKYLVDLYPDKSMLYSLNKEISIPIIGLDEINEINIDFFVISSFEYRYAMSNDLRERGYDNIINLYDFFKENGICTNSAFYFSYTCSYSNYTIENDDLYTVYNSSSVAMKRYEYATYIENDEITQVCLYEVILHFLKMKDFFNAKIYMLKYIEKRYDEHPFFVDFLCDLEQLLEKIKNLLTLNKEKNIIVFVFDSLENSFLEHMPFLSELKQKSIVFSNSFTQYCFTSATLQTMFSGKDLIDELSVNISSFSCENSELTHRLRDEGYGMFFLSPSKSALFKSINQFEKKQKYPMSDQIWSLLNLLINSSSKGFYMLHFLEPHPPYNCAISDTTSTLSIAVNNRHDDMYAFTMLKAFKYTDDQMKFFDAYFPADSIKIMMSDHGTSVRNPYRFPKYENAIYDYTKTMLFVNSAKHAHVVYDKLFCLRNFKSLVFYLIGLCDDKQLYSEYVKLQALPFYDEFTLEHGARSGFFPLPKKGILTEYDKYTIDYNGAETYNLLSDDPKENKIAMPEYQNRIEELRKSCGSDFNNLFEQPKFAIAKKVYKEHGVIK